MVPQKIEEIYAWIITDEDGSQHIPIVQLGNTEIGMIGADKDSIEAFREYAHTLSRNSNRLTHMVRFRELEVLETFIPDDNFLEVSNEQEID